jgi:hypothetical protein
MCRWRGQNCTAAACVPEATARVWRLSARVAARGDAHAERRRAAGRAAAAGHAQAAVAAHLRMWYCAGLGQQKCARRARRAWARACARPCDGTPQRRRTPVNGGGTTYASATCRRRTDRSMREEPRHGPHGAAWRLAGGRRAGYPRAQAYRCARTRIADTHALSRARGSTPRLNGWKGVEGARATCYVKRAWIVATPAPTRTARVRRTRTKRGIQRTVRAAAMLWLFFLWAVSNRLPDKGRGREVATNTPTTTQTLVARRGESDSDR